MSRFDLEARLLAFAGDVIAMAAHFKSDFSAQHLSKQLIRSATSAVLNYAEAQSGESRKDFIHKLKVSLKELRETHFCLRLIKRCALHRKPDRLGELVAETNELISILVASIKTAGSNRMH